jgi:hypothetical protein
MLVFNPMHRISAKAILKHPYFANLDKSTCPVGAWDGELQLDPDWLPKLPKTHAFDVKSLLRGEKGIFSINF